MDTPLLSFPLLYFFFIKHRIFWPHLLSFFLYLLFVFFFSVATRTSPFLEMGRWSSVCGHTYSRSCDHLVSRQSHMYRVTPSYHYDNPCHSYRLETWHISTSPTSVNLCRFSLVNLPLLCNFSDTGATPSRAMTHLDFVCCPVHFGVVLPKPAKTEDHLALPKPHHGELGAFGVIAIS
jgi:hypothetical protein